MTEDLTHTHTHTSPQIAVNRGHRRRRIQRKRMIKYGKMVTILRTIPARIDKRPDPLLPLPPLNINNIIVTIIINLLSSLKIITLLSIIILLNQPALYNRNVSTD